MAEAPRACPAPDQGLFGGAGFALDVFGSRWEPAVVRRVLALCGRFRAGRGIGWALPNRLFVAQFVGRFGCFVVPLSAIQPAR
eukprot:6725936-Lingulodinium_polyedra.AAC.1